MATATVEDKSSQPSAGLALAVDARARLGECVLWCDRTECLLWTDIDGCRLEQWHPASGERRTWPMPEPLGSFALCESPGRLLLGLASGVALFDMASGVIGPLVPVEADLPATRINDGRCDRQGRFVFGTFNRARQGGAIAHFYRVGPGLDVQRLPLPAVRVANGIAFSPAGDRIHFADSPTREILCADYHADGRIGEPRRFVRFADDDGYPDGATVDAQGGLWSAHWDGGCVVRYAPDGRESCRIALPLGRPTCTAFGGTDWGDLYISTATVGLDDAGRAAQPWAGGIVRARPAWPGLREPRFGA